ncbi:MAG: tyrosine--tRNA ligase [Planctomycetota bacterium]|jgi:tyrosyl-tRNA synthetase
MSQTSWRDQFGQLARTVETVFPGEKELDELLGLGRPLRVKFGIDITATEVTIGNAIPLRILGRFLEMGHTAVLILGDFTTRIGDPSGKDKTRPVLTPEQINANEATWLGQLEKILDVSRAEVRHNSEWMEPMGSARLIELAGQLTVAQMLERESFAKRYREGSPIQIHEFLYCVVQGYDSVAVEADIELGGTDQTFNLNMGRTLQKNAGMRPQVCVINPLLEGVDGAKKMSKSLGNSIGVATPARDMFGLATRVPDELVEKYILLATDLRHEEAAELLAGDPWEAKKRMASALVARYYGADTGAAEREEFERVFRKKELPDDMPEFLVADSPINIANLVRDAFGISGGEARRLVQQGAVSLDGAKVTDPKAMVDVTDGMVLKAGKRRYAVLRR